MLWGRYELCYIGNYKKIYDKKIAFILFYAAPIVGVDYIPSHILL